MCAVVPKRGVCALRVRVVWRTVCSRVCSHINWLGWEVSVCSDRLGVLGVLRRLLCGGREESVCCHIYWLGLEVSVCSDRLGDVGVVRRFLLSIHYKCTTKFWVACLIF